MSTAVMNNLLQYLYGTMSNADIRWMAQQMMEHAEKEEQPIKRYTKQELLAMVEESERQFERGECYTTEEVMRYCLEDDEEEEVPSMVAEPALEEAV